jgi:hypothetical protein
MTGFAAVPHNAAAENEIAICNHNDHMTELAAASTCACRSRPAGVRIKEKIALE